MFNYKALYRDYLNFSRDNFLKTYKLWFGNKKASKEKALSSFNNYYKSSFFSFLNDIRLILYLKNPFEFTLKRADDRWDLFEVLDFLCKKKLIEVKNNKIITLNKSILEKLPPILSEREIKKNIEKRLKSKLISQEPVSQIFKTRIKSEYDQLPISTSSAIFLTQKILENLPFSETFLFIGDDDLISLFLTLSYPKAKVLVVDIDKDLLRKIRELSQKFKLKIETQKIDIRKFQKLGKFTGFLANPPQNYFGIKTFVKFGVKNLGEDGGSVFLEVTDENIGNRYILLQKFFYSQNLIIQEVINGKLYYPYCSLHEEDKFIDNQLNRYFDKDFIKKQPKEGIDLWVMEYYPWKIKEPQKGSMFDYL